MLYFILIFTPRDYEISDTEYVHLQSCSIVELGLFVEFVSFGLEVASNRLSQVVRHII